jgi:uncharacterized protein YegP (UPF0339 family)
MSAKGQFEIYRDVKGVYRWRMRAANGKVIADSPAEGYQHLADCEQGMMLVSSQAAGAYVIHETMEKRDSC